MSLERALVAFALEPLREPTPVENSVLNLNYRVETADGRFFVRSHRPGRSLERIQREQAAAAWASAQGLPVATPVSTDHGQSIIEVDGRFWSAYTWVEGSTCMRGSITPEQAERLGAVHGRCLTALRGFPSAGLPRNSELSWSTTESLAVLRSIESVVSSQGSEQERRWHATQLRLLESDAPRPSEEFSWLPLQPTHGDFHERNVMFSPSGELSAVVDWERFCLQPPAFEVLRAVSFMLILEEQPLRAYLQGLAAHFPLDPATVAPAVDAWWQSSIHNTWAFRDTFRDGNTTARQFLPEEESRSRQFNDPAFRDWLTGMILRFAA